MDNKKVFASNLNRYMQLNQKSRKEVSEAIGVSYYTFTDWVNAKKYPRMDKVEKLARYFGILISDLIEEKTEAFKEAQKNNDTIVSIVKRLRTDGDFLSLVESLNKVDAENITAFKQLVSSILK